MADLTLTESQTATKTSETIPRPKVQRFAFLRDVIDLVVWVGIIYVLVNLSTVRFVVQGGSMEPTFNNSEYLIISRVNYLVKAPGHGDLVVFHYPNNTVEDYIKRVIGIPGDTVEIRDTLVYVNGVLLDEPYINGPCEPRHCRDRVITLDRDEYFVMGDNRNRSRDSRDFGAIQRSHIVGEVLLRYWPPSGWGFVGHIDFAGD